MLFTKQINHPWLNGRFPSYTNGGSGCSWPNGYELDSAIYFPSISHAFFKKEGGVLTPRGNALSTLGGKKQNSSRTKKILNKKSFKGPKNVKPKGLNSIGVRNKNIRKSNARPKGQFGDIKFTIFVPLWTELLSPLFNGEYIHECLQKTMEFHDNLIKNHGIQDGTKRFKAIFLYASLLLEDREATLPGWVAVGKVDKWPTKLSILRPVYHLIKDNKLNYDSKLESNVRRFFLTLSKLNRVLEDFHSLEVANLKQSFRLKPEIMNRYEQFARTKLGKISDSISRSDLTIKPFFGPNNGPNSVPKLESAGMEAYQILFNEPILLEHFTNYCRETSNMDFLDYMKSVAEKHKLASQNDKTVKVKDIRLRKLTSIADSGNKSRTIAICDFWTQSLLQPIEAKIIGVTHKIYKDNCAFSSHSAGWEKIKNFLHPEGLKSLDATEWTDNLPSSLQYIVMKILFGQKIADAWKAIAVSCPWFLGNTHQTVRYGKGQGMGTKGSFVIAQLTNLIFIDMHLKYHYPNIDNPFFIEVGDDMVIEDPDNKLAGEFELIGVPINVSKTKLSTPKGHFVEFVSRNLWNNHDISIVSPPLVIKYRQNTHYVLILLYHLRERGINITLTQLLDWKCKCYELEGKPPKAAKLKEHNTRVLYLAYLFHIAFPEAEVLTPGESVTVPALEIEEEKRLIFSLILLPLSKLEDFESVSFTRDQKIERERLFVLSYNLYLQGKSIWQLANDSDLDLSIVRKLGIFGTINNRKELLASVGYNALQEGFKVPELFVVDSSLEGGPKINPEALRFILNLNVSVNKVILDTKFVSNLSILDKANSKCLLALFSDLNKCYSATPFWKGNKTSIGFASGLDGVEEKEVSAVTYSKYCSSLGLRDYVDSIKTVEPVGPLLGPDYVNQSD